MGLIENAKEAAKLVQQIGNIELYEKLISLQTDAMALIDENWTLKDEVRQLKEKLKESEERFTIQSAMEFVNGDYYQLINGMKEGPFCQVCWDIDRRVVRMQEGSSGSPYCSYCSNHRNRK